MRVNVLGPMEVADGDGRRPDCGPKERAVLAVPAVEFGRVVSVRYLVEVLWDDHPPATAINKVEAHISALRRELGQRIVSAGPVPTCASGYQLVPADLDLTEFATLATQASVHAAQSRWAAVSGSLAAALALWRGPVFVDVKSSAIARAAAAWEERRLLAVESKAQAELNLGAYGRVINDVVDDLSFHPLRERLRGLLMVALYRHGCRAEALETYRIGRRISVDRLGVEPAAMLRRLHQAILTEADDFPPNGEPAPATTLSGCRRGRVDRSADVEEEADRRGVQRFGHQPAPGTGDVNGGWPELDGLAGVVDRVRKAADVTGGGTGAVQPLSAQRRLPLTVAEMSIVEDAASLPPDGSVSPKQL